MLILSRKVGEVVQIGDSITVTVVSIEHGRIKIGIDAPRDVSISRPDAKKSYGKTEGGDDDRGN